VGPNVYQLTNPDAPAGPRPAAAPPTSHGGGLPRPGWPAKDDLDYAKTAIELTLLLLALPYIIRRLATSPKTTVQRAGRKQLPAS
jgi:hypothetical protein